MNYKAKIVKTYELELGLVCIVGCSKETHHGVTFWKGMYAGSPAMVVTLARDCGMSSFLCGLFGDAKIEDESVLAASTNVTTAFDQNSEDESQELTVQDVIEKIRSLKGPVNPNDPSSLPSSEYLEALDCLEGWIESYPLW